MTAHRIAALLTLPFALSACGDGEARLKPGEVDPQVQAALDDQLLIDPDLSHQNEGNAAFTANPDHALPLPERTDAEVSARRDEAEDLLSATGGERPLPRSEGTVEALTAAATYSLAARAALTVDDGACIDPIAYGFEWAARMPAAFPVYPRAATQEAAGSEVPGCSLRAVAFRTPVALEDVLAFYSGRAATAGYRLRLQESDGQARLVGGKAAASLAVYGQRRDDGTTDVVLVTRAG